MIESTTTQAHEKMLIGAEWVEAASGETFAVENPCVREAIARVPRASAIDVDLAVKAAAEAFPSWRRTAPRERGRLLMRIADQLDAQAEEMARTLACETGNAIRTQSRPEARFAADVFRYFGGLAGELKGHSIPLASNVISFTQREPLGVVAAIVPWNGPLLLTALKVAPAICAGNTIVVKTAEDAPLATLRLARICSEVLPPGVVNMLTGYGAEAGAALAQHPQVRKISFTGSTAVGQTIMRAAADNIAPVSLELGGKSPSIVFPDANEDWAVKGVMDSMRFTRQSQSCTAGSRLFVHERIFDSFVSSLVEKTKELTIGDALDEATDIGSLINQKQHARVCSYIEEGMGLTKPLLGGLPPREGPLSKGYYAVPTIFAPGKNDWRLSQEEIFGPVLMVIPWKDVDDAIEMANASHYGLAAYVWTKDFQLGLRTAQSIESGWVQVNRGLGQILGQPYGGIKKSGIGREFSLEGMLESFTTEKAITLSLDAYLPTL